MICLMFVTAGVAISHKGTRRFRDMVDAYAARYQGMTHQQKKHLIATLIRVWKEHGGRFLVRHEDGLWYEEVDAAMVPVVRRRLLRPKEGKEEDVEEDVEVVEAAAVPPAPAGVEETTDAGPARVLDPPLRSESKTVTPDSSPEARPQVRSTSRHAARCGDDLHRHPPTPHPIASSPSPPAGGASREGPGRVDRALVGPGLLFREGRHPHGPPDVAAPQLPKR
jgi:hypothetical protein